MKKRNGRKPVNRVLLVATLVCFCMSFYVAYYKLVIQDDWMGFFYDMALGLFTGLLAGIALYYLTLVPLKKKQEQDENQNEDF